MSETQRTYGSEYMQWAKTSSPAKFNLATSGLANLPLQALEVSLDELEITTAYGYGYPPLMQALAARLAVDPDSLVTAAGTTFANHLALAALISAGDEILIEQPTYEPLLALARYLGADVKRFERRFEDEFQIDLRALERSITPSTRLIVLTNLHNPSGVLLGEETIKEIGAIAGSKRCRVLIDEVYLETFFQERPRTAFNFGPEFIVTSSLTKAYGLSGLRCGWIVAASDLARRMWLLNDLFAATPVHAGERLSLVALRQLERIGADASALLERNRKLVNQFLDTRNDLEAVRPKFGTIVFPRLKRGNADEFTRLLREQYQTSVVPGRFFEMPAHFRLGLGGDTEVLRAGLQQLGSALDELT
jgi:aspartate/methionine/tyrosine aminotransferase